MSTQTTNTMRFSVKGMSCGGCVRSVQKILAKINGIVDMEVRVGSVTAVVESDRVDAEAIRIALRNAGYAAELQSDGAE